MVWGCGGGQQLTGVLALPLMMHIALHPGGDGEGGVTALTDILLLCQFITSDTSDVLGINFIDLIN